MTYGLEIRCGKTPSQDSPSTYDSGKSELTPQLTPESRKQAQIDTPQLPPDLAEIVAIWPKLPEHIKAAVMALVGSVREGDAL